MRRSVEKGLSSTARRRSKGSSNNRLTPTAEVLIVEIRAHEDTLRSHGVEHLYVFGSYAKGTNQSRSDLDILVRFPPHHRGGYFAMARVKATLEDELGLKADVQLADQVPSDSLVWLEALRAF